MMLLLFFTTTIFLPVLSLRGDTLEERLEDLRTTDEKLYRMLEDPVLWFSELCGDRIPNNTQAIVRFLEEHPENVSVFETFAQNTVFIGQFLIQLADSKERRELIRRRMDTFIEWLIDLDVNPYHDEPRVYVPRERDSSARDLREIFDLTTVSNYGIEASGDTMDDELMNLRNMNVGYLFTLSLSTHKIGNTEWLFNSVFAMMFRPYTHMDRFSDADRAGAIEYLRGTISNILKNRDYRDEEAHRKLLEALKYLNGTMPSSIHFRYVLAASCVAVLAAVIMFVGPAQIRLWLVAACLTSVHWTRRRLTAMRRDNEREETSKRMISERRQLETKVDRMQRELQSATDKKKSLEERLRSVQEERDSLMAQMEAVKEQAALKERELSAEVGRTMAEAAVNAQEKHQLQSEYAQARAEAQSKEYELTEILRGQCLVSQSLNDDVEEMKRLILAITEANDALMASSQPENASREAGAWPCENDVPATSHDATPSDVPSDPAAAYPVNPSRDESALDQFIADVYATLYSRPHGYDSIPWFLRDLRNDSGIDGERMARSCGYDTFEAFLQSAEMASRVLVTRNAEGVRLYKVYPAKEDLENYVAQQLGTDYGETKRSLAFHREENSRLRSQLAATLERMERLKTEALKPKARVDSNRFRATGTGSGSVSRNTVAVSSDRFRKANTNEANTASTSHSVFSVPIQDTDDSAAPACMRTRMDNLERMVQCSICMDRPKDTAFACGHTYCEQCATDLRQCTFGCKKTNGKPLKFKYRIFL